MICLIVADTHGFLDERIARACDDADLVVHAGDVGASAILERLGRRAPLAAVRGNNDTPDKWQGQAHALRSLPDVTEVELEGGTLVIEHGHQAGPARTRHDRLRARHPQARAIAVGHSHHLVVDKGAKPWVLNPGAAGRVRTFGGPSYIRLVASPRRWTATPRRLSPAT